MSIIEDIAKDIALVYLTDKVGDIFDDVIALAGKEAAKVDPLLSDAVVARLERKRGRYIKRLIRRFDD